MNRSTTLLVIAVALLGYGIYAFTFVPTLLVGAPLPLLLIGFILQVVFALAAAFGVWRDERWAAAATVLLGVSIAGTALCEAFILGIAPYLHALMVSLVALVITLAIAMYVSNKSTVKA